MPIGFFVEAEQAARHVDEQLVEELSHTPIPKKVWPEILGMSLEGRKVIADYLEQQEAPAKTVLRASLACLATLSRGWFFMAGE